MTIGYLDPWGYLGPYIKCWDPGGQVEALKLPRTSHAAGRWPNPHAAGGTPYDLSA